MTRQQVVNIINDNIVENNVQAITATKLNYVLMQIFQYLDNKKGYIEFTQNTDAIVPLGAKELVLAVAIYPAAVIDVLQIGTALLDNSITELNQIPANQWTVIQVNYLAPNVGGQICITGISSNTTIRIYKN